MTTRLDYHVILQLCRKMEKTELVKMERALLSDPDALLRFRQVRLIVEQASGDQATLQNVRKAWPAPEMTNSRFLALLDEYTRRYIKRVTIPGKRGTKLRLQEEVEGRPKWNRMENALGVGSQYHDSVRMIALLCHLDCAEFIEFLWSAGHPLTPGDLRDDIIADCIYRGIYEKEDVDARLIEKRQKPLFQLAQARKKSK